MRALSRCSYRGAARHVRSSGDVPQARRSPLSPAFRTVGFVLVMGGLTVFAAMGYFGFHGLGSASPPPSAPATTAVDLSIHALNGVDAVTSANFSIPAHALVTFTILNYDPSADGGPMASAGIEGSFVGPVRWSPAPTDGLAPLGGLAPAQVSHTFSILDGPYALNVPIPAASGPGVPTTVVFSLYFNETGTFTWYCWSFCPHNGLSDGAQMGGTFTVGFP